MFGGRALVWFKTGSVPVICLPSFFHSPTAKVKEKQACVQVPEGVCEWLKCRKLVIALDLISEISRKLKIEDATQLKVLANVQGKELEGCSYRHPLFERESPVVIGGDYITTEAGTGLVHTAPGHGQEDFIVGQRCSLPILSPVDDAGAFTSEAGQFEGLNVLEEGNQAVIEALKRSGALLRLEDYKHKYPYDWRTRKPTIFRATDQWFASVEGFKQAALDAIRTVEWMPAVGENRITGMTEGRCVS
jgi:isoleucyl-tRNA synthetase